MDFSLIKLNILLSEGKIWVTDLHLNVLTIDRFHIVISLADYSSIQYE